MILSYESLLQEWIKSGEAEKIFSIQRNKQSHMDYFLSRDSGMLMELVKDDDNKTLVALLRCFDEETRESLRQTALPDAQRDILFDIDNPEALATSFLLVELEKAADREKGLVV